MPLNVSVTLNLPSSDRSFTVHIDRQRWSAEQLAAVPDGRAHMERAIRRGVREAALSCAYAQFTEADIDTAEHPDSSVTMTGRVLCDESECHAAAQRHHLDAAESIEARAAADWAAEKDMGIPAGERRVVQHRVRSDHERRQRRASLGLVLIGALCAAADGAVLVLFGFGRAALTK